MMKLIRICQLKNKQHIFLLNAYEDREMCMIQVPCTCVNMIVEKFMMELLGEHNIDKQHEIKLAAIDATRQSSTSILFTLASLVGTNTSSIRKAITVNNVLLCLGILTLVL